MSVLFPGYRGVITLLKKNAVLSFSKPCCYFAYFSALMKAALLFRHIVSVILLAVSGYSELLAQESIDSLLPITADTSTILIDSLSTDTISSPIDLPDSTSQANPLDQLSFPDDNFSFKEASKKQQRKEDKEEEKILDPEMIHARRASLWGIIPGGGQIYNRRWWKLPIVYGVLGAAGWFVVNSATEMKRYNTALDLRLDNLPDEFFGFLTDQQVVANRNFYRRNLQLGAVGFTALWGLSIVDAVVDAHLKTYDISDDLSLKFRPSVLTVANKSVPSLRITLFL